MKYNRTLSLSFTANVLKYAHILSRPDLIVVKFQTNVRENEVSGSKLSTPVSTVREKQ